MLTFQWPLFIFLLPVPFVVRYFWRAQEISANETAPEIRFPHLRNLQTAFKGAGNLGQRKQNRFLYALFLAWACLVFALMRPQFLDQLTQTNNDGHDLMLAVDLSGSMQSLDFSTANERISRLDVAKQVVGDFLKKRVGDRIGLILFGEHAYLNSPLTLDTSAVGKILNNSLSGMAGDATAIGDAVGLAVKNLRDRPASSRAIILLTDGDDNASTIPPLEAAELAKQYGIHIYTVVIGKEGPVPFPNPADGHIVMVDSQVNTTLTKKMAEITGGEFYTATDRQALSKIYDRIDALEKTHTETQNIVIRQPLFQYPMLLALLVLGGLALVPTSRRESYGF